MKDLYLYIRECDATPANTTSMGNVVVDGDNITEPISTIKPRKRKRK